MPQAPAQTRPTLDALRRCRDRKREAEAMLAACDDLLNVEIARAAEARWSLSEIGAELGISKQRAGELAAKGRELLG